ncbi:MAG: glycosyltransferase family 9 protein, partial [Hyphomicrobiales bacterium]
MEARSIVKRLRAPLERHHPARKRFGRWLGGHGKRILGRLLDFAISVPANQPLDKLGDVRRVLLVRPNFRIGNTLITTPLVLALRRRFPGARLDYLAGDRAMSLLAHLPLDHVYCVSSRQVARPWKFFALFVRLRRVRYDVAVDGGMGSFSGGLYAYLTGARYRIGCSGSAERFFNVRFPSPQVSHAYDMPSAFARLLGVTCPDRPVYQVGQEERAVAVEILRGAGLANGDGAVPFTVLCVGGHDDKHLSVNLWIELAQILVTTGMRLLILLGPDEVHLKDHLRHKLPATVHVMLPQPLRVFAALTAMARLVVTPDSGPMHLVVAVGVPTVVLLQAERS